MELELNRKLIQKVLNKENIGIWVIDLKQGKETEMYLDESGRRLMDLPDEMSAEETFRYWYDNIREEFKEEVVNAMSQMKQGKQAEVQYIWRHPKKGQITVRCSGVGNALEDIWRLEGCYQDVTGTLQVQGKTDDLASADLRMEKERRENQLVVESLNKIYFAVHHLNMISAEFYTYRTEQGGIPLMNQAQNMYEAMDILCEKCVDSEHYGRMKVFTDLSTIQSRMKDTDILSEDIYATFQGWITISFIVAERNEKGEITDLILTGRRINREKKEVRIKDNMLRALSMEYQSVYRVNAKTGECFGYRMSYAITGQFGNRFAVSQYADSIRIYKEGAVLKEDWPLFEEIDSVEKLGKVMEERNDYVFPYRVYRNEKLLYFVARIVKTQEMDEYVLGFKSNDEIVLEQKRQEYRLREALEKAEKAEQKMRILAEKREKEFRLIHEILNSGMWSMCFDEEGNMCEVLWSKEFRSMIGYKNQKEFPNTLEAWLSIIHPDDVEQVQKEYYDTINDYTGAKTFDVEYRLKVKSGEYRWFHTAGRLARREDGTPESYTGIFEDITQKKYHQSREDSLEKQAMQDSLTGLYNRRAYDFALERIANQDSIENITLIALDVNYLKRTNDSLGHAAGDELLCGAAQCIRESFAFIGSCYRIGGDEFAVIIEKEIENINVLLEAFQDCMQKWKGKTVFQLSISSGFVQAKEQPFATLKRLQQIADENMYQNKKLNHLKNEM